MSYGNVRAEKRGLINLHREIRSRRMHFFDAHRVYRAVDRPCPPKDLCPRRDTDVVFYPFSFSFFYSFIFFFFFPQGTAASNKFLFVRVAGSISARENMASPSILFRSVFAFLAFSSVLFWIPWNAREGKDGKREMVIKMQGRGGNDNFGSRLFRDFTYLLTYSPSS